MADAAFSLCLSCRKRIPQSTCPACGRATIPTVLEGRYELQDVLGRGGMGWVFRAVQLATQRAVAVKLVDGCDAPSLERFRRESVLTARLEHPNALRVYDQGVTSTGSPYLVMELLQGHDLRKEMNTVGAMPLPRAVALAAPMFRALHAAHGLGIIHRDIKPSNVFLHHLSDGQEVVKVMDFGIAILAGTGAEAWRVTQTGVVLGTAQYMSPEQAKAAELDARTDVYSAGLVFYELLAGVSPFKAETPMQSMIKQVKDPAPPMGRFRADLARHTGLQSALDRLLAKDRNQRPATALEAATLLERLLGTPAADAPVADDDRLAPAPGADPALSQSPVKVSVSSGNPSAPNEATLTLRAATSVSDAPVSTPSTPSAPSPATIPEVPPAEEGVGIIPALVGVVAVLLLGAGLLFWPGGPLDGVRQTLFGPEGLPPRPAAVQPVNTTDVRAVPAPAPSLPDAAAVGSPVALAPARMVALEVRSTPPGAEVTINGVVVGRTPLTTKVTASDRELPVFLEKAGFKLLTVPVVPDQPRTVDGTLTPAE